MELFALKGKAALVTGAARGIGKATAELFEAAGAKCPPLDVAPGEGRIVADVADEAAVERGIAEAVRALGGLDILVNNAGIAVRKTSFEISVEDWDRVIGANLRGLFLCSRVAARAMKKAGGGAIVNLPSLL